MDRYEEALKRARSGKPIEEVFPEIEEEKIQELLHSCVCRAINDQNISYDTRDEISRKVIPYLEKQKEQKSLNISAASEWLRKHVCRYMNSEYNEFHKCVEYDGSIDKEKLINDFEEAMQKEQKSAEKPKWYDSMDDLIADALIEMVEKSDLIDRDKKNRLVWIEKHRANSADWSEEDERNLTDAISAIEHLKNDCDWGYLGVGNDIDNVLNFLESLPERFNLKPKQEWSKEDKK